MNQLTIPLPKKQQERLSRLAIKYGLSLPEFSAYILSELADNFPVESFRDYKNPVELKASFARALKDWHKGKVSYKL